MLASALFQHQHQQKILKPTIEVVGTYIEIISHGVLVVMWILRIRLSVSKILLTKYDPSIFYFVFVDKGTLRCGRTNLFENEENYHFYPSEDLYYFVLYQFLSRYQTTIYLREVHVVGM